MNEAKKINDRYYKSLAVNRQPVRGAGNSKISSLYKKADRKPGVQVNRVDTLDAFIGAVKNRDRAALRAVWPDMVQTDLQNRIAPSMLKEALRVWHGVA